MSGTKGSRALGDGDNSNAREGHGPDPPSSDDSDHDGAAGDIPSGDDSQGQRPDTGSGGEDDWALGQTDWVWTSEHEDSDRRRMLAAFLVGALAGIMILGLVWATTGLPASTDSDRTATTESRVTSAPTSDSGPSQETQVSRSHSLFFRCRQADRELAGLLLAAGPAMDQWEVHIGAMNKLVVGAITLQQATAFWNQTRAGAKGNLEHFRSVMRENPFAGVDCPSRAGLMQASTALGACVRLVSQERQALEAARIAVRTWGTHVRHMEMLRMGQMSPAVATQLWLTAWRQGIQELRAYQGAVRAVDASGRC